MDIVSFNKLVSYIANLAGKKKVTLLRHAQQSSPLVASRNGQR